MKVTYFTQHFEKYASNEAWNYTWRLVDQIGENKSVDDCSYDANNRKYIANRTLTYHDVWPHIYKVDSDKANNPFFAKNTEIMVGQDRWWYETCNVTCLAMMLNCLGITSDTPSQIISRVFEKGNRNLCDSLLDNFCDAYKNVSINEYMYFEIFEVFENLRIIAEELYGVIKTNIHSGSQSITQIISNFIKHNYPVIIIGDFYNIFTYGEHRTGGHYILLGGCDNVDNPTRVSVFDPWDLPIEYGQGYRYRSVIDKNGYVAPGDYPKNGAEIDIDFITKVLGPSFAFTAITERRSTWSFPFAPANETEAEIDEAAKEEKKAAYIEACYRLETLDQLGGYPFKRNALFHNGIHITPNEESQNSRDVVSIGEGKIIAARLNKKDKDNPVNGSNCFILIKHKVEYPEKKTSEFYSMYMHCTPLFEMLAIDAVKKSLVEDKVLDEEYRKEIGKLYPAKDGASNGGNAISLKWIYDYLDSAGETVAVDRETDVILKPGQYIGELKADTELKYSIKGTYDTFYEIYSRFSSGNYKNEKDELAYQGFSGNIKEQRLLFSHNGIEVGNEKLCCVTGPVKNKVVFTVSVKEKDKASIDIPKYFHGGALRVGDQRKDIRGWSRGGELHFDCTIPDLEGEKKTIICSCDLSTRAVAFKAEITFTNLRNEKRTVQIPGSSYDYTEDVRFLRIIEESGAPVSTIPYTHSQGFENAKYAELEVTANDSVLHFYNRQAYKKISGKTSNISDEVIVFEKNGREYCAPVFLRGSIAQFGITNLGTVSKRIEFYPVEKMKYKAGTVSSDEVKRLIKEGKAELVDGDKYRFEKGGPNGEGMELKYHVFKNDIDEIVSGARIKSDESFVLETVSKPVDVDVMLADKTDLNDKKHVRIGFFWIFNSVNGVENRYACNASADITVNAWSNAPTKSSAANVYKVVSLAKGVKIIFTPTEENNTFIVVPFGTKDVPYYENDGKTIRFGDLFNTKGANAYSDDVAMFDFENDDKVAKIKAPIPYYNFFEYKIGTLPKDKRIQILRIHYELADGNIPYAYKWEKYGIDFPKCVSKKRSAGGANNFKILDEYKDKIESILNGDVVTFNEKKKDYEENVQVTSGETIGFLGSYKANGSPQAELSGILHIEIFSDSMVIPRMSDEDFIRIEEDIPNREDYTLDGEELKVIKKHYNWDIDCEVIPKNVLETYLKHAVNGYALSDSDLNDFKDRGEYFDILADWLRSLDFEEESKKLKNTIYRKISEWAMNRVSQYVLTYNEDKEAFAWWNDAFDHKSLESSTDNLFKNKNAYFYHPVTFLKWLMDISKPKKADDMSQTTENDVNHAKHKKGDKFSVRNVFISKEIPRPVGNDTDSLLDFIKSDCDYITDEMEVEIVRDLMEADTVSSEFIECYEIEETEGGYRCYFEKPKVYGFKDITVYLRVAADSINKDSTRTGFSCKVVKLKKFTVIQEPGEGKVLRLYKEDYKYIVYDDSVPEIDGKYNSVSMYIK